MATFRLKVWTGPVAAFEMGRKLRRAGLRVPTTGTEHFYVDVKANDCTDARIKLSDTLRRKYKKDFGLRAATCQVRRRHR